MNGTSRITISYNTSFQVAGKSIALVSGNEYFNIIHNNLFINNTIQTLSTSIKTSSILIRNFLNDIYDNIIYGNTKGTGILASIPSNIVGSFIAAGRNICISELPLSVFTRNTILNCDIGFQIENSYDPQKLQCSNSSITSISSAKQAEFSYLTLKYNKIGISIEEIGSFMITNSKILSNFIGIKIAKLVKYNVSSLVNNNEFLITNSEISPSYEDYGDLTLERIGIIFPYSNGLYVTNVVFTNFVSDSSVIDSSNKGKAAYCISTYPTIEENIISSDSSGGNVFNLKNIIFTNSNSMIYWYQPKNNIIIDLDGSLTKNYSLNSKKTNSRYIIPKLKYTDSISECYSLPEFSTSVVCTSEVIILKMSSSNSAMQTSNIQIIALNKNDNNFSLDLSRIKQTDLLTVIDYYNYQEGTAENNDVTNMVQWIVPLVTDYSYYVEFYYNTKQNPQDIVFNVNEYYKESYNPINLIIKYLDQINYSVKKIITNSSTSGTSYSDISPVSSSQIFPKELSFVDLSFGSYYDDRNNYNLYYRLSGDSTLQKALLQYNNCETNCQSVLDYEDKIRVWSNGNDWPSGNVPSKGESVTVDSRWRMILDIPTEELQELRIKGLLFPDSSKDNLSINTYRIIIESGKLQIGTSSRPYLKNFKVNLLAKETSEKKIDIGSTSFSNFPNNLILNLGDLDVNGEDRSPYSSKLLQSCFQTLKIYVDKSLSWRENDEIIIMNSGHDMRFQEKQIIKSYNSNTGEIVLKNLVQFSHYGNTTSTIVEDGFDNAKEFDERAEVIMITRNIEFNSKTEEWGGTLISTNVNANGDAYASQMNITNAVFNNFGQFNETSSTAYPGISITGMSKNRANNNIISGVSIISSMYTSLRLSSVSDFDINNILIYETIKHGLMIEDCTRINIYNAGVYNVKNATVYFDSDTRLLDENENKNDDISLSNDLNNEFEYNLFSSYAATKSLHNNLNHNQFNKPHSRYLHRYLQSSITSKIDITSCYYICPDQNICKNISKNNLTCGGSHMFGYVSQIEPCSVGDTSFNKIKSFSTNGGVLLTNPNDEDCVKLANIHSFNNVGYGIIIAMEAQKLILKNSVLSNNLISVSINTGFSGKTNSIEISNLLILGRNKDNDQQIDSYIDSDSNSISARRQIGIMLPTITQSQRFPPLLLKDFPLEKPCCYSNLDGRVLVSKVLFMNWEDQTKIDMSAISTNYYNKDKYPLIVFDEIILRNVLKHTLLYVNRENDSSDDCVDNFCSDMHNKFLMFGNLRASLYTNITKPEINSKWYINSTETDPTLLFDIEYYNITSFQDDIKQLIDNNVNNNNYDLSTYIKAVDDLINDSTYNLPSTLISQLNNKLVLTNTWSKVFYNDKIFNNCIQTLINKEYYWNSTLCNKDNWIYFSFMNTDEDTNLEENKLSVFLNNALFALLSPDSTKDDITNANKTYYNNYGSLLSHSYLNYHIYISSILPKKFTFRISDNYFYNNENTGSGNSAVSVSSSYTHKSKIISFNYDKPRGFIVKKQNVVVKPNYLKEGDDFLPSACGEYYLDNIENVVYIYSTTEDDCLLNIRKTNALIVWLHFETTINEWTTTENIDNLYTELSDKLGISKDNIHITNILRGSAIAVTSIFSYSFNNTAITSDSEINSDDVLDLNEIANTMMNKIKNKEFNTNYDISKVNYTFSIVDDDASSIFTKDGGIVYNETRSDIYDAINNITIPIDYTDSSDSTDSNTTSAIDSSSDTDTSGNNGNIIDDSGFIDDYWWVIVIIALFVIIVTAIVVYYICKKGGKSDKNKRAKVTFYKKGDDDNNDNEDNNDKEGKNDENSDNDNNKMFEDIKKEDSNQDNKDDFNNKKESLIEKDIETKIIVDIEDNDKKEKSIKNDKNTTTSITQRDKEESNLNTGNSRSNKKLNVDEDKSITNNDQNINDINNVVKLEDLEISIDRNITSNNNNNNIENYNDASNISKIIIQDDNNKILKDLSEIQRKEYSRINDTNIMNDKSNIGNSRINDKEKEKSRIIDFGDYNEYDKQFNDSKMNEEEILENNKVFKDRLKNEFKL